MDENNIPVKTQKEEERSRRGFDYNWFAVLGVVLYIILIIVLQRVFHII